MIALRPALEDRLSTCDGELRYELQRTQKLPAVFIGFVETSANDRVTIDLAVAWATLPADRAMSWWAARLRVIGVRHPSTRSIPPPRCRQPTCCPIGPPTERCRTGTPMNVLS